MRRDSIVNKTPLDARTNRMIGGDAPSKYLPQIQRRYDIEDARMDSILGTHVIAPAVLRMDDFEDFFQAREAAMLERIERAIGKQVIKDLDSLSIDELEDWDEGEPDAGD